MDAVVTIDDYWLTFLVGTALPALTALVTRRCSASSVKALVLLALSALTGALTTIGEDGRVHVGTFVVGFAVAYITAVSSHFGLLKPTGVTGDEGAVMRAVPAGIGRARESAGATAAPAAAPARQTDTTAVAVAITVGVVVAALILAAALLPTGIE